MTRRQLSGAALIWLVLLCGLTLLAGYANKARCTGPEFTEDGRSVPGYDTRKNRDVCYSDIQHLWITRDLGEHNLPYLSGGITEQGTLYGGTVEYPVLSGLLIWLGGLGADTDASFLLGSALLMAPFGLATAWMLGQLSGWRALLWGLGPPLVLYAFHNWDLPVVACAVGAVWVMHRPRGPDRSPAGRGVIAAVLLGLGFALKLYPAVFVLPLAIYVLTSAERGYDVRGALRVCGAAAGIAVLANLPFLLLGYSGWRASLTFQQLRQVDITTNSIWFWAYLPASDDTAFQSVMDWLSPLAVLGSFALAVALGWRRYRRDGSYPWVAVSAAMLCGFLLLHEVHSPQYTLWLLPFFVLLRVRWGWIAGYLVADIAMGIGIFRWYYQLNNGLGSGIVDGLAAQAVAVGVWGRAALLVALFWVFLHSRSTVDSDLPRSGARTRLSHRLLPRSGTR
ncbi:MAG: glycosyltransferase family 87 protein, partial [Pseudonocardiaceae bacterium]